MIMAWRMLPEVTKYMYTDPKLTLEDQKKWFANISQDKRSSYWVVQLLDGTDVGVINLCDIDLGSLQAGWGCYIADERARGKGLGKTLECNIYEYAFGKLGLNKVWGEVFAFNERVVQIHQKYGMEVEGTLRDHVRKNGEFHDVVRMAVMRSKWLEIRDSLGFETIAIEE